MHHLFSSFVLFLPTYQTPNLTLHHSQILTTRSTPHTQPPTKPRRRRKKFPFLSRAHAPTAAAAAAARQLPNPKITHLRVWYHLLMRVNLVYSSLVLGSSRQTRPSPPKTLDFLGPLGIFGTSSRSIEPNGWDGEPSRSILILCMLCSERYRGRFDTRARTHTHTHTHMSRELERFGPLVYQQP
ncbi:hypothetical protein DM02DRAFT_397359 [Periconia macrospinosa]|uniref:Uncharacterized protein n=1 Tax=Periconia macrospinosa TaxID=97972 RepID=A0A2V1DT23_9PLEO|nr:hypothetical protein DM02DRAFT_397359 [Periconia macrospinosa]